VKKIVLKDGEEIYTPWLTVDEAAKYCGYKRSTFYAKRKKFPVPYAGDEGNQRYHIMVLDAWMEKMNMDREWVYEPVSSTVDKESA